MAKAHTETGRYYHTFVDSSSAEGDVLTSLESWAQTQLCNLPLLFVVHLIMHSLTKNIIHRGKVSHDVTAFSGTQLCQFTQLGRGLYYIKVSIWKPFSNVCCFRGANRTNKTLNHNNHNKNAVFDVKTCGMQTFPESYLMCFHQSQRVKSN